MIYLREYNAATTIEGVPLVTRGSADFKVNPTIAAGDAKISKDGGSFVNLTTLPAVTPAGSRSVKVSISAAELTAKQAVIDFIDQSSPKEWEDQRIIIETTDHANAQYLGVEKAVKLLANKAVQDKSTGVIDYYDDDGETVILTHTPSDSESTLTRTPS